jgi:hypothetical protein
VRVRFRAHGEAENTLTEVHVKIFVPIIAAACLAAGCIGCGSDKQIVAPPAPNPQSPTQPSAWADFPGLTHPGTIYGEKGQLYAIFFPSQTSLISRYVIYDDGSFELEFISATYGFFRYAGTYTESGTGLTLNFADSDSLGPWLGTAALSDDQMSVEYSNAMLWADFIDGVYVRVPPQ